jgi:hypothetical protein
MSDGGAAAGEPQIELEAAAEGGAAKGEGAHGSVEAGPEETAGEEDEILARGGCDGTTTSSSPPKAAEPKTRDGGGGEEERVSLFAPFALLSVGLLDEETFEGGRPIVPPMGPGALAKDRRGLVRADEPGAARPLARGPVEEGIPGGEGAGENPGGPPERPGGGGPMGCDERPSEGEIE